MARASLPLAPLARARLFSILVSFACVLGSLLRAVPSPLGDVTFFAFLGLGLSTCCYAWLCACFHHSVALYDMYHGSAPGTSDVLLSIMCFRDRHVPFPGALGFPISSACLFACAFLDPPLFCCLRHGGVLFSVGRGFLLWRSPSPLGLHHC